MGPNWLGFPSIVLGKEKGADRKIRLFQGIDSVTVMVQRGWGAAERQRRRGPKQEEEAQEAKRGDLRKAVGLTWNPENSPCFPTPQGFQAMPLRTLEG